MREIVTAVEMKELDHNTIQFLPASEQREGFYSSRYLSF